MLALFASIPFLLAPAPIGPVFQDPPATTDEGESDEQFTDLGEHLLLNLEAGENAEEGIDLETLTKFCSDYTGINFTYDDATGQSLKGQKVRMFGLKKVPKEDFYNFFQILMFINDFVCTEVGPEHLRVVVVQPLSGGAGGRAGASKIKEATTYVLPEELPKFADQVATPITTVLTLNNMDVRQLTNSLRSLLTDSATQSAIPVGNTNSVILQGFANNVASLAQLLELVNEEMGRETEVKPIFDKIPLEFASPEDVADIVEQLLEAARRAEREGRVAGGANGATGQIPASGGESKIIVDSRTSSLIVMALPGDMQNIKELVARLDVDVVEPERTYRIHTLENVNAEDVADVLEEFISNASRVTPTGSNANAGTGNNRANSNSNEVVVVPDPTTNSLLIAASKSRYEEILDLIRSLDKRQDQVLIETALIELTSTDLTDLGIELGLSNIPDANSSGGFGVTNFGLSSFVDTDNDGIPDIRQPNTALQGITGGILDGDDFSLPILLRALRTRRDTNVLNVPSVLVNNNGFASVSSLDEQPTTTITAQGGVGGQTQENFDGYQEAGITLEISPSISASGYLRLDVYLQVSSFLGAFQGAIPPPRVTRTMSTTVNVPDGSTMVIGGIITDNKGRERNSTPWLGDLPVLGALFRRDEDSESRTTLYFFVTPHILDDKDFADLHELSYRIKMDAARTIGADRVKLVDPNFPGADDRIDLSSFDVPLYTPAEPGEIDAAEYGHDPVERSHALLGEMDDAADDGTQGGGVDPDAPTTDPMDTPVEETGAELEATLDDVTEELDENSAVPSDPDTPAVSDPVSDPESGPGTAGNGGGR